MDVPDDTNRRREPPARLLAIMSSILLLALVLTAATAGEPSGTPAGGPTTTADGASQRVHAAAAQLDRGAEIYAFSCTTCHGATGAGFAEARAAFPADHYDCIRCHGPRNPPQMTPLQIEQSQSVFSLGDAPPLADAAALARFGSAAGLYAYVRATMPRWDPGRLDDDAYLDVTAFVLHLAGVLPDRPVLTLENVDTIPLDVTTPRP